MSGNRRAGVLSYYQIMIMCVSRWLSVWCNAFDVNFGEIMFPGRLNYPRPQKISKFDGIHDVASDK